jgi:hypothetical protein
MPERKIIHEFTNAQHPLNMVGVSKRRQKRKIVASGAG